MNAPLSFILACAVLSLFLAAATAAETADESAGGKGSLSDAFEFKLDSFDVNPSKWGDEMKAKMTKVIVTSISLAMSSIPLLHIAVSALVVLLLKKATWTACAALAVSVYGHRFNNRTYLVGGLVVFYLAAFSFWSGLP
ncbi:VP4 [Guaico Culex virus]|nr:VP4 [Guaico Culex virus]AKL90439.1 VP4 [Guaico Culex virus]AKL90448.1 VP4 [Guaico Culex virus]AKL90457.1 VP4 [Guaico Culex virus]AKL90465.1 VP4 [Guaico Culex virus]